MIQKIISCHKVKQENALRHSVNETVNVTAVCHRVTSCILSLNPREKEKQRKKVSQPSENKTRNPGFTNFFFHFLDTRETGIIEII